MRVVNVLNGRRDYPPASHACIPDNRINCISLHVVLLIFIQYLLGCSSICLKFGFTLVQLSEKIQKNIIIPLILEIFRFFGFFCFSCLSCCIKAESRPIFNQASKIIRDRLVLRYFAI